MRKLFSAISAAGAFLPSSGNAVAEPRDQNAHAFAFVSIDGAPLPLEKFRGKVVLIVNTASFCGFTKQYEGLQALWERYGQEGLMVVGVPSNDFGGQEPKGEGDILEFCRGSYGITFPLTEKVKTTSPDAHPFYQWAGEVFGPRGRPRWNFHKYLISADGRLVRWFSTGTKPLSGSLIEAIEHELAFRPDAS